MKQPDDKAPQGPEKQEPEKKPLEPGKAAPPELDLDAVTGGCGSCGVEHLEGRDCPQ